MKRKLTLTRWVWIEVRRNFNGAFVFLQLDPQTLHSKDWQRTVIGLNGVSLPPPSTRLRPTNRFISTTDIDALLQSNMLFK